MPGVKVEGVRLTQLKFQKLAREIQEQAQEAVKRGAYEVKALAIKFAPVKSGKLEKSGRVTRETKNALPVFIVRFSAYRTTEEGRFNYGDKMHEWDGGWGKKTAAKAAAQGMPLTNASFGALKGVGAGYLARAASILAPQITAAVRQELQRAIARAAASGPKGRSSKGGSRRRSS